MPAQGQMVNEVHVERVAGLFIVRGQGTSAVIVGLNLDVGPFAQVVPPPRQQVASRHRHRLIRDSLLGWRERSEAHRLPNSTFIDIALYGQMVTVSNVPIGSAPHLSQSPGIEPSRIGMEPRCAAVALSVDTVVEVPPIPRSVAEPSDALIHVSTADGSQHSMRVFRALGDDVDHSGDRIGSPDRAPGTTDDFDALNIFEHYAVLQGPIDAGKKWGIKAPAVHQDQHGL